MSIAMQGVVAVLGCGLLLAAPAQARPPVADFVVQADGYSNSEDGAQSTAMYNAGMQCAAGGAGVRNIILLGSGSDGSGGWWATAMAVCGGAPGSGEMPAPY
jgi:hypothetical protein